MIVQDIHIYKYDWVVRAYFNVDNYYPFIVRDLKDIGCDDGSDMLKGLLNNSPNSGFTFSSSYNKASVLVVSKCTSPEQFQNTFDHEKGHLAMHIAETFDINVYSEEFQYLTGSIGQLLYLGAKDYICDCDNQK